MRPLIAAIADVHLAPHGRFGGIMRAGVNARARMIADVLAEAVARASEARVGALVVCGDLHDVDDPSPQVLALSAAVFAASTVPVVLLVGNHDQRSTLPGDHCLGPLAAVPGVYVIESPRIVPLTVDGVAVDILAVPFEPAHAAEYIPQRLAELSATARPGSRRILAAHVGVADHRTSHFLRDSHEAIRADALLAAMRTHGTEAAVVGNWHDRCTWGSEGARIRQCGALVPTGWDNPGGAGKYGGLNFYTPDGRFSEVELPGPRFFVVRNPPELAAALADSTASPPFVRWDNAAPEMEGLITAALADARLGGFAVEVDRSAAATARADAAVAARNAVEVPTAVRAYVTARTYPAGVTAGEVLAAVEAFLGVSATSRDDGDIP